MTSNYDVERKTTNESSDLASTVNYKFILKPQFISEYIPGMAKKLPLFNFLDFFSPLKILDNSSNSHVPVSTSEMMHRTHIFLTLLGTTSITYVRGENKKT